MNNPDISSAQPALQSSDRAGKPVTISVIMPTFNRAHWVGGALKSLTAQQTDGEFDYEVVVVDNASKDDTKEVIAELIEQAAVPVRYLYSEKPGDAPTRNCGIRAARGQWLAFFDDDQFADPHWLVELYRTALESKAPIVGGPVHLDLTDEQLENLGRVGRSELREIKFYPSLQPYQGRDLPGTGNALVERRLFDEFGLFDETMTCGGSDSDFFLQSRDAGHQLWYTPKAIIRHRIEPNRMTREYMRWGALSGGALHTAHFDYVEKGRKGLVFFSAARVGQAALVHLPLLTLAWLRRDPSRILTRRIKIWRAEGYLRGALRYLFPRMCKQKRFFESCDFRFGREIGKTEADSNGDNGEQIGATL